MKLAFDYQIFSLQAYGGISRYFVRLFEALEKIPKTEAKIFAAFHINQYLRTLPGKKVVGMGMTHHPWRLRNQMPSLNRKFCGAGMHFWGADVIHETYYSAKLIGPSNTPRVVTVYDMIHELFSEKFSPDDATTQYKRAAVERADHVICISQNTRNDLMRLFGTPADKISVIHLACEHPSPSPVFSHPAIPNTGKPYLLYVGARAGYKNFSGMLRAVANSEILKNEFRILCFGGGNFLPREIELLSNLGFESGQVSQMTGDDDRLNSLYAQAAAFVYPSLYEGFGLPPLEAMAQECPVVTSQTSSMPEVVGLAGEYFDPTDVDSITQAIESVVMNPTRRSELIALGRKRINDFSWKRCAEETNKVYDGLTT